MNKLIEPVIESISKETRLGKNFLKSYYLIYYNSIIDSSELIYNFVIFTKGEIAYG